MEKPPKNLREFDAILNVVRALRGPGGCPWDKEQTPETLAPYALEEAYELAEAIEEGDPEKIKEELGDVLLQVVLHAHIAKQEKQFDINDVIEGICSKLVRRHPHVFASVKVKDSTEVLKNWDEIKASEKAKEKTGKLANKNTDKFSIPVHLPALQRSGKIGDKTHRLNFDWDNALHVFEKVEEEFLELKEALGLKKKKKTSAARIKEELGDLLFSLAQLARHLKSDPEQILRNANRKFEKRFFKMKNLAEKSGRQMKDYSTADLEKLWQQIKRR